VAAVGEVWGPAVTERAGRYVRSVTADHATRVERFRALHVPGNPLVMPNPWDAGSARLLAELGFAALATTSGGFAGTLGRPDGSVRREEAVAHLASVAAAVDVPVSGDLEDGYAAAPTGVADTVLAAIAAGAAGCSIEDSTRDRDQPIYDLRHAVDRVAAAADAARTGTGLVLTARAENHLHGRADLADTIARLQAYQEAGADVLYAPGLADLDDIRRVVAAVDRPVNVLIRPGGPTVPELAAAGAARISVGSLFAMVAFGALARAGRELLDAGTHSFTDLAADGRSIAAAAFRPPPAGPA
jgi:2-methylisocitrate lyase-like PEP mutase family enzyme